MSHNMKSLAVSLLLATIATAADEVVVVEAGPEDAIFFNNDIALTGDLTVAAVTDNPETCYATGSPPEPFTSQAPQFCLSVSGT